MARVSEAAEVAVEPGFVVVDDLAERVPESVFVVVLPGDDCDGGAELWRTARNERAVLVFTTIAALVAGCGGGQPWVGVPRERLFQVCRRLRVSVVGVDVPPPEGARYPEPPVPELGDLDAVEQLDTDSVVYVPSRPVRAGDVRVQLELQPDRRGRPMLLAYTGTSQLRDGCGPYQAWVSIRVDRLTEAVAGSGAGGVLVNPVLSEDARHTGPVLDWTSGTRGGAGING